ncbi:MAG: hypothetical protein HYZ16_08020 [Bacteroidetes bacterium]|nr:hypothetical protein [Bacteroidota bacterium]
MAKHKRFLLMALALLVLATACRKELKLGPQTLGLSFPIASTSLSLKDFTAPENYLVDDNGQVRLKYELNIYESFPISYFSIPDRHDYHKVSLETIRLSNTAMQTEVTLEQAYPPATLLNGQKVAVPALDLNNASKVDVDANTFFESAQLESGKMYLKVHNGFPVEITHMFFLLTNKVDGRKVAEMEFFNILPGETEVDSADMTGVYAEGFMVGELVHVGTAASVGEVTIKAKDAIKMEVSVRDLKAFEAKAIFPAQNLIDFDMAWDYDFGGPEITELRIKSGKLWMQVVSNVDETIYVTYEVPALISNGDTVVQYFEVPPASSGNPYSESKEIALEGFDVILRGKRGEGWKEVNAFHNRLIARIDSTGILKKISKNDSITLHIALLDIVPSYAKGYLGQKTIEVGPASEEIGVFRKLDGLLDIKDIHLELVVHNSSGVEAEVTFTRIASRNSKNNTVDLTSAILNSPMTIPRAPSRDNPIVNAYAFDQTNSNIDAFVENLPIGIEYGLKLMVNPNGNTNNHGDFVFDDSYIKATALLDLPMNLKPEEIAMRDTFDVSFESFIGLENLKRIGLNLIIENGYPFAVDVDFHFLDADNNLVDTLFAKQALASPGLLPEFGDKVGGKTTTVLRSGIEKEQFTKLADIKRAVITTRFVSTSTKSYPIYDAYTIDATLTADLEYIQVFD